MSSLREIKDRIGSVRSTLKITNAMKLVSSAKLRKAQQAIEALRPYETTLSGILAEVSPGGSGFAGVAGVPRQKTPKTSEPPEFFEGGPSKSDENVRAAGRVAVVAVASNSSLCGSFNGNVLRKTLEVLRGNTMEAVRLSGSQASTLSPQSAAQTAPEGAWPPSGRAASGRRTAPPSRRGADAPFPPLNGEHLPVCVDVYPIGRRIADPLRKAGYPAATGQLAAAIDLNDLAAHPSYEAAAELAQSLADAYADGVYSKVILIYNHFVSSSRQEVVCETYLPWQEKPVDAEELAPFGTDYIVEPSAESISKTLLPQVMRLKIYAMLLDSAAAEHAARMIAMQTATDNAQDILDELTLEYNKGRQQQITAEILDIVGGSQQ